MRDPGLLLAGAATVTTTAPLESERQKMRAETASALSSARLAEWQDTMERAAGEIVTRLSVTEPVDLVAQFARPWCLIAAATITGVKFTHAEALFPLAEDVCAAAADPYDAAARAKAKVASPMLQKHFLSGPAPLREPAFVGLSQTLPSLLANMWVVLFAHPHEYAKLRADRTLFPSAIEELLRCADVPRTLYRFATRDVVINGLRISQGQHVILKLSAAHRDELYFPDPEQLDFSRRAPMPLSLGVGTHSCIGGNLIRIAAGAATGVLINSFEAVSVSVTPDWVGGDGFRTPNALWVQLIPSLSSQ
jgi:cytochrome P450